MKQGVCGVYEREREERGMYTSGIGDGGPLFPRSLLHFNVAKVKDSRDGLEHGQLLFFSEPQSHHSFLYIQWVDCFIESEYYVCSLVQGK